MANTIEYWQEQWKKANAAGDQAGMNYAHQQANALRNSMGLVAGKDYDAVTGASLTSAAQSAANSQSLRDWAKQQGIDVDYNNGTITLSKNGNTVVGTNLPGLTLGKDNYNYISDPSIFNTTVSSLFKTSNDTSNTKNNENKTKENTPNTTNLDLNKMLGNSFSLLKSQLESIMPSQPSASVPDLQSTIATLRAQLDPQHAITTQKIAKARDDTIKALMENLAKRGGGLESSEANKQIAELYANADNAQALTDAEYEAMLANLGQTGYENAMSRYENAQNMYTQAATNLGMSFLTGAIDLAKFLYDASYRAAVLGSDEANTYLTMFGSVN